MKQEQMTGRELQKRADKLVSVANKERWSPSEFLFVLKMITEQMESQGHIVTSTGGKPLLGLV